MLNFLDLPYMAPHPGSAPVLDFAGKSLTIQKIVKNSSGTVVGTYTVGTFSVVDGQQITVPSPNVIMFPYAFYVSFSGSAITIKNSVESSMIGAGNLAANTYYLRIIDASSSIPDFTQYSPSITTNNTGSGGSNMFTLSNLFLQADIIDMRFTQILLPQAALTALVLNLS